MSTTVWRWLIAVFGIASMLVVVLEIASNATAPGDPGFTVVATNPDFHDHIAVTKGGPADRAGLRSGDIIDRREVAPRTRLRIFFAATRAGEPLDIVAHRGTQVLRVTVIPVWHTARFGWFLAEAGYLLATACGLIVGLRAPDRAEARVLALLLCTIGWYACTPFSLHSPWLGLDLVLTSLAPIPSAAIYALVATYGALFGRPLSMLRRVLTYASYGLLALFAALQLGLLISAWTAAVDLDGPAFTNPWWTVGLAVIPICSSMLCGITALREAVPSERTRLAWAMVPLIALLAGESAFFILTAFFPSVGGLYSGALIALDILNFIVPVALAYSVLSRHALDIGFALNRAAMFSATTLLVAGAFAGAQWLATVALSGVTLHNPYLQLGITLVVYYIVRISRTTTETFVSRLFFAARQRRIAAIHEIANAVDEVRTAEAIPAFVVESLRSRATIDAGVSYDDGAGHYALVAGVGPTRLPEDEPLLVRTRSLRIPLLANDGSVVVPMLIRNRLRGLLICRAPQRENELAPDEVNALAALALRMAIAREDLLAEGIRHIAHSQETVSAAVPAR